MAPPPPTSYKALSEGWKWYSAQETRPDHAPPFTMKGVNTVIIPNGELFCRFDMNYNTDKGVQLCYRTDKQSHWANLKRHVEFHRVQVDDGELPVVLAKNRTGGLTMKDHHDMVEYWDKVKQQIDEYDPECELEMMNDTPTRPETRHLTAPKVKDLQTVPMTKERKYRPPRAKVNIMRALVHQKKSACDGCVEAGRKACPNTRKAYCQLWMQFKPHAKEQQDQ